MGQVLAVGENWNAVVAQCMGGQLKYLELHIDEKTSLFNGLKTVASCQAQACRAESLIRCATSESGFTAMEWNVDAKGNITRFIMTDDKGKVELPTPKFNPASPGSTYGGPIPQVAPLKLVFRYDGLSGVLQNVNVGHFIS